MPKYSATVTSVQSETALRSEAPMYNSLEIMILQIEKLSLLLLYEYGAYSIVNHKYKIFSSF